MGDAQLIKRMLSGDFPDESKQTHKDVISQKFFERVDHSGVDFEKLLKTSENDMGRVYLFKKYFEWIPFNQDELNLYRKNSITASRLLEKGRKFRSEKNNKEALLYYNLAICCAPHPSNSKSNGNNGNDDQQILGQFFEALCERSDLLLAVRGGEEAIRDINLAVDLLKDKKGDLVESMKTELEERRKKCHNFLGEKLSFMMELAKDSLEEQEKRNKYRNLLLFKIKQSNPLIPSAEGFVEIRVDPVKGRQLIVNRDIPPGTTMVVEEPYVKVLKNSIKWDMNHCHYCFRRIRGGGGIPCQNCVFEIYCAPECMENALKRYHKYECPCYPYLHITRTQRHIHMAIRVLSTVGPSELYRIFKTKDPRLFNPNSSPASCLGADPETNIYDSQSYLPIYHLISHTRHNPDDMSDIEYFTNVLQGLIFATCLEKYSSFYDEISYLGTHPKEFFKTFIASMILHHIENVVYNSISLDELTGLEGITLLVKEPTILNERIRGMQFPQYGAATYALASLINHSCEPNTTRVHDLRNGRMAFVALKGIKKGEELVTSYSRVFLADTRDERRDYLKKTYNFICQCIACSQDWPPLLQINEGLQLSCSNCSKRFRMDEKFGKEYGKVVLDKKGRCLGCKKNWNLNEVQEQLEGKIEAFFKAYDLILKNKPLEAIRLIAPCIQHFQDGVVPPYRKLYMAQDLLKSALDLIVYYSEAK